MRSVMFYAAETCAMPVTIPNHLRCYGRLVDHLICNVKENDKASLDIQTLDAALCTVWACGVLRWKDCLSTQIAQKR